MILERCDYSNKKLEGNSSIQIIFMVDCHYPVRKEHDKTLSKHAGQTIEGISYQAFTMLCQINVLCKTTIPPFTFSN